MNKKCLFFEDIIPCTNMTRPVCVLNLCICLFIEYIFKVNKCVKMNFSAREFNKSFAIYSI